jgi:hypothetical protein
MLVTGTSLSLLGSSLDLNSLDNNVVSGSSSSALQLKLDNSLTQNNGATIEVALSSGAPVSGSHNVSLPTSSLTIQAASSSTSLGGLQALGSAMSHSVTGATGAGSTTSVAAAPAAVGNHRPAGQNLQVANIASAVAAGVPAAAPVQSDHVVANPHVIPLNPGVNPPSDPPPAQLNWASYFGVAGATLAHDVVGADGNIYMTGSIPDPNTGGVQDMLVAEFSPDGTQLLNSAAIQFMGATNSAGHGIDVDNQGNMYVIGDADNQGYTARSYFRLQPDFQTITWTLQSAIDGEGNSIKLDASQNNFYLTGWTDGTSFNFPSQCVQVSKFTDLGNPNGPTNVFGYLYSYQGIDGTIGTSITPSSQGLSEVATNFITGPTTNAGLSEFSQDGTTGSGAFFAISNPDSMNDIQIDKNDLVTFAGTSGVGTTSAGLIIGHYSAGNIGGAAAFVWSSQTDALAANAVATDSNGFLYTVGSDSTNGVTSQILVFKFTPDGGTITDSALVGGSKTDVGHGLALDSSASAYVVGTTNSPDFPTTAGAYQMTYGGDPSDGVVMKIGSFM